MKKNHNIKATLLGATGLIGSKILENLKQDQEIESITAIVRRKVNYDHPKVKEVIIDFKDLDAFQNAIEPDSTIFCAIGTTNKKVNGNKTKYRAVDYDIPVNAAEFGIKKGCDTFALVSSTGADSSASNFYTKLKGEVEDKISGLGYKNLHIFRPSILLGDRKENRVGERIAKTLMCSFSFLLPGELKPIRAEDVAKAMFISSKSSIQGSKIYYFKDIVKIANN